MNTNPIEHKYYNILEKVVFDCFSGFSSPPHLQASEEGNLSRELYHMHCSWKDHFRQYLGVGRLPWKQDRVAPFVADPPNQECALDMVALYGRALA